MPTSSGSNFRKKRGGRERKKRTLSRELSNGSRNASGSVFYDLLYVLNGCTVHGMSVQKGHAYSKSPRTLRLGDVFRGRAIRRSLFLDFFDRHFWEERLFTITDTTKNLFLRY